MTKLCIIALAATAMAQTHVDLRTQAKSVDFSGATSTKPVQIGTALPPACSLGQMFLNTSATPGANLYSCDAFGVWLVQSGSGKLAIQGDGQPLGSITNVNFQTGAGLVNLIRASGLQANVQSSVDTAVIQTQAGEQSGAVLLCASAGASASAYRCSMTPTALRYSSGMTLHWRPDVAGAGGGTTLNVDTLGAIAVKLSDGVTNPAATDIVANTLQNIWFDGTVFRLPAGGSAGANRGPLLFTANNGTGGTESYPDSTSIVWTCGSGSAAVCTGTWTVPAGINWVRVQGWAAGGGGGGSSGQYADLGGGGGGYWESVCPTIPGAALSVGVGLAGAGLTGFSSTGGNGGNSSFGACFTVLGGSSGGQGNSIYGWGGRLAGSSAYGWFTGTNLLSPLSPYGALNGSSGAAPTRADGGGNGAGQASPSGSGLPGAPAIGGGAGGGSGGNGNSTGGAGGTSALGAAGGNGGGWTLAGGVVACTAGAAPGGGGGAAGVAPGQALALTGCGGGRGELRIYYAN